MARIDSQISIKGTEPSYQRIKEVVTTRPKVTSAAPKTDTFDSMHTSTRSRLIDLTHSNGVTAPNHKIDLFA